jgi:hypothetical protein
MKVTSKKLLPVFTAVAITALLGSNVAQAQNQGLVLESVPVEVSPELEALFQEMLARLQTGDFDSPETLATLVGMLNVLPQIPDIGEDVEPLVFAGADIVFELLDLAEELAAIDASMPSEAGDILAMRIGWRAYFVIVEFLELLYNAALVLNPDAGPVEPYDLLTGFMQINMATTFGSSATGFRGRPRFAKFNDPDTRVGIDNSDTRYLMVHVPNEDGKQIYRVWGNRSNTVDMLIQVFLSNDPQGGLHTIEDEDMVNTAGDPLGLNDDFVIMVASAAEITKNKNKWQKANYNILEIPADKASELHSRYTASDWETETAGDIFIEREGTDGVAITQEEFLSPAVFRKQVIHAANILGVQGLFWGLFGAILQQIRPVNFFNPWIPTEDLLPIPGPPGDPDDGGSLGITSQLSSPGWAQLDDDQAMIISFPETPADYGGFMLFNFYGESYPWGHVQSSLTWNRPDGDCQAQQTEDGLWHIVVSAKDPGVQNWVDTMGRRTFAFTGRLQSIWSEEDREEIIDPEGPYHPTTIVVPVDDVLDYLPDDTKTTDKKTGDPDMREKQMKIRQAYQRRKYAPW